MLHDSTESAIDNVSDLSVPTGTVQELPGYAEWIDDRDRNDQAAMEAELEQLAARAEREQLARRTLGTIDPATAPALSKLIEDRHGATNFYDVTLSGEVVLHGKYYDLDPTELDALRSYVVEHNAAQLKPAPAHPKFYGGTLVAVAVAEPRWETQVSICGKRFEAAVRTPAGKVVKVGRFFNEADAWNAAESRLAMLKAAAA